MVIPVSSLVIIGKPHHITRILAKNNLHFADDIVKTKGPTQKNFLNKK
jgi:hypothetical protein